MTPQEWIQRIDMWHAITPLKTFSPANDVLLTSVREKVAGLPIALEEFYKATNGLTAGSFKVLPIEDPADMKRTWDSIQRANRPMHSRFLGRSADLMDRFIVFADVGVGRAGAFDREDGSIWYEEGGQLRQTNLSFDDFLEASLCDISGL